MKLLRLIAVACALATPVFAEETQDDDVPVEATGSAAHAYEAFLNGRYEEAIAIWLPLANDGDASAQFNIGVMYANGLGVDRDMSVAMSWWGNAARQLHVRAAHNLALAMLAGEPISHGERTKPDFTAILRYLKIGADAGYPNSEYTMGKLYADGVGVEKDERRAAELYLSASIKGFAKAQYNLGKVYRDGTGMRKDESLSLFWFSEAAERGHGRAQDRMAERCLTGRGVPKDEIEALKWSILASRQGVSEADRRRFELSARLPDATIAEAERRAAAFAPRKGPVLELPRAVN
ncbi:MAG: sel1 repeat family protein [Alphaproteobacteria bacterium]|nr:sel1 repeat family protein [Alphaproteobacteria bacterium]